MEVAQKLNWYALRVFKNRLRLVKKQVEDDGYRVYQAMTTVDASGEGAAKYKSVPLIPSLLFVKVPDFYIEKLKYDRYDYVLVYCDTKKQPAPIREEQMDVLMLVTSQGDRQDVSVIEDGEKLYKEGDPVRVIGGFYKGAVGVVRRIKKDRKLLVAVDGVAVVAVSNIPMEYLEKI